VSEPQPAVVFIPGGTDDSARFVENHEMAATYRSEGIVVVVFDPDGRGKSEGVEDYNGFVHQDGLAAVITYVTDLPGIDPEHIGLVSYSYGVTMATGALARHPDLPIRFYIDWEGPVDREDTTVGCAGAMQAFAQCSDDEYWAEREALTFIISVQIPYQRLQSERDHVQPDVSHAIRVVNAAVQQGVPWVRLNDLPPNQSYDPDSPPQMLTEQESRNTTQLISEYVVAMFARVRDE
jgi:pimeloyl-ACP methyl ester carboxylesterase